MNIVTLAIDFNSDFQLSILGTLLRHNPEAKIFTSKESIAHLPGGSEFLSLFNHLNLVHFADAFRVWYLLHFGGLWIDADTIHMRPMGFPYELNDTGIAFCYQDHTRGSITNHFIYSPNPGNKFLSLYYERQKDLVANKSNLAYLDLGEWSIQHIIHTTNILPTLVPHWEYHYMAWYSAGRFFETRRWDQFQYDRTIYNPNSYCYHLTNMIGSRGPLADDSFFRFLMNRATGVNYPNERHTAILSRMPDIRYPYQYAEIGVYEASTASIVGQQRENCVLHLIDTWKNTNNPDYLATGDYHSYHQDSQHEANYQRALEHLWFLLPGSQNRTKIYRATSIEAATSVPNHSMDMVFIDADHSYKAVKQDIATWLPKVKSGGYLGGHDYAHPHYNFGVKQAVDEIFSMVELDGDYTWFVRIT